MNCENEMKMKKWSSQWTQCMQLGKEAWKKKKWDFNGVWTRDLAIPVRCSTNWALKPLTLGAGQLWVHIFPWKNWVLMVYEINHIRTAEMKLKMKKWSSQWTQFMQLRKEAWKQFRTLKQSSTNQNSCKCLRETLTIWWLEGQYLERCMVVQLRRFD